MAGFKCGIPVLKLSRQRNNGGKKGTGYLRAVLAEAARDEDGIRHCKSVTYDATRTHRNIEMYPEGCEENFDALDAWYNDKVSKYEESYYKVRKVKQKDGTYIEQEYKSKIRQDACIAYQAIIKPESKFMATLSADDQVEFLLDGLEVFNEIMTMEGTDRLAPVRSFQIHWDEHIDEESGVPVAHMHVQGLCLNKDGVITKNNVIDLKLFQDLNSKFPEMMREKNPKWKDIESCSVYEPLTEEEMENMTDEEIKQERKKRAAEAAEKRAQNKTAKRHGLSTNEYVHVKEAEEEARQKGFEEGVEIVRQQNIEKVEEANKKLADAEKKVEEADLALSNANKKLKDAEKKLEDASEQLSAAQVREQNAQQLIEQTKVAHAQKMKELEEDFAEREKKQAEKFKAREVEMEKSFALREEQIKQYAEKREAELKEMESKLKVPTEWMKSTRVLGTYRLPKTVWEFFMERDTRRVDEVKHTSKPDQTKQVAQPMQKETYEQAHNRQIENTKRFIAELNAIGLRKIASFKDKVDACKPTIRKYMDKLADDEIVFGLKKVNVEISKSSVERMREEFNSMRKNQKTASVAQAHKQAETVAKPEVKDEPKYETVEESKPEVRVESKPAASEVKPSVDVSRVAEKPKPQVREELVPSKKDLEEAAALQKGSDKSLSE